MKSGKKESIITEVSPSIEENVIEEARQVMLAAKDWVLDDASLLSSYWHDKMGYMEAWVSVHWNLVLEQGHGALDELDELEDLSLLWLVDHVNNNPVPLRDCHVAGHQVDAGSYLCMACSCSKVLTESSELSICDHCGYGMFSTHMMNVKGTEDLVEETEGKVKFVETSGRLFD